MGLVLLLTSRNARYIKLIVLFWLDIEGQFALYSATLT